MAAVALTPRVRMMAICDGVRESKIEPGVFDLKGVRQHMGASGFPFVPARLWLFLVLSSPRIGVFPCYLRIENDRTERTVYYSHLEPRPTFAEGNHLFVSRYPVRCVFPEPGQFTVQVWFFQEQGNDVLKGEISFPILPEE